MTDQQPGAAGDTCLRCGAPLRSMGVEQFRVGGTSGGWKLLVGEWAEIGEGMLPLEVLTCEQCRRVELRGPGPAAAAPPPAAPSSETAGAPAASVDVSAPVAPRGADEGYAPGMKAGATLATIFAPFIALIVAFVMLGNETNPVKRAVLRAWAWTSTGVLAVVTLIGIVVIASILHSDPQRSESGICQGGPIIGAPSVQVGPSKFRFPCEFGGTTVIDLGPTPRG